VYRQNLTVAFHYRYVEYLTTGVVIYSYTRFSWFFACTYFYQVIYKGIQASEIKGNK